jgi:DNA-binding transcriptional regulator GbsR (MarR family)
LINRVIIQGERKEHFTAEKEIWKVAAHIIRERKKRELDPMIKLLAQLENIDGDKKEKETRQFLEMIGTIKKLGQKAGKLLDVLVKAEENKFTSAVMKALK